MSNTKKQHFISQYILKRFLNKDNKIDAVILLKNKIKRISTNVKDICAERDFYETKNSEGQYIERNRTEKKFATIEDELAKQIDKLFQMLEDTDPNQQMKEKN